jgi:hypothetical protein
MTETLREVERLVAAAAGHDQRSAEAAYRAARGDVGTEAAVRLERIARGEAPVSMEQGIGFVGEASPAARRACTAAMRYLQDAGVPAVQLLLVDCAETSRVAMTIPVVPGAAYVVLPGRADDLAAAAMHELAHAHISSGNAFLDEGMAYHFELSVTGRFPEDAARRVAEAAGCCPGCRTLLAYDALDDPYFDKLLPGNGPLVHAQGALVFGALSDRMGIPAAAAWYKQLAPSRDGGDTAEALEAALGESLENLDLGMHFRPGVPLPVEVDARAVGKAYVRGDHGALEALHASLVERGEPPIPPDRDTFEAELMTMVSVAAERAVDKRLSRLEYAMVKGRLARYVQLHGRTPRYLLFRGMLAFCRAPGEENDLDATLYLDDARADLEMALARAPCDAQVLACVARWEWRLPEQLGGSRERARDLLERIAAMPEHADDVRVSLDRVRARVP